METLTTGKIGFEIEMKDITPKELSALTDYFVKLTQLQIHRFKNGKVIMHFDSQGELQKIEMQHTAWKKKKGVDNIAGFKL